MMSIWHVELKGNGDYGDTHFDVIADSYCEAWKKALELEYEENIVKVYHGRRI